MAIFDFNNLSSLSDVELSVYRFVVNNPEKVAYMRVRDIAKKTHVANSSVMRFVHKIGFASFPEFKAYLKNINQTVAPQKALTFIDQQNFPNDIENKLPLGNATQVQHLSDLLNMSDVVSLHVPENPSTKNMMGAKEISLMKLGSLLINASRGTVVDIPALCDALASKHLAGAAIDVFPKIGRAHV